MFKTDPVVNQVIRDFSRSFKASSDVKKSLANTFDTIERRYDENEIEFIEGITFMDGSKVSARVYQNAKYPDNPRIIVKVSQGNMIVKDWYLI